MKLTEKKLREIIRSGVASIKEAKFVKDFDKKVLDAETEKDILKIYPDAETFVGKHSHFFGQLEPNLFYKAYYKENVTKKVKEFLIVTIYSKKGSNYVDLYSEYEFVEESLVTEATEYITDKYKVGDTIKLVKYNWKVVEVNFKPGKSYKDAFTFFDSANISLPNPPPTNKKAVGYKLEADGDTAFLHCYNSGGGKTIMKLAIKGFNESVDLSERVTTKDIIKTIKAISKQHNTSFINPFLMHKEPTHMHKKLGPVKIHPGVRAYDWRNDGTIAVSVSLSDSEGWSFTGAELSDLTELPKNYKLPRHWLAESVVTEAAIDVFADEMNDEGVVAGIFDAVGDGRKVDGQFTKKKWDDGVPVTKYFSRGGIKTIATPKGKFQIIETPTFWYYEINKGWAAINKIEHGTPPFEY